MKDVVVKVTALKNSLFCVSSVCVCYLYITGKNNQGLLIIKL